jgi:Carboxymuconolactone decarboxylase family
LTVAHANQKASTWGMARSRWRAIGPLKRLAQEVPDRGGGTIHRCYTLYLDARGNATPPRRDTVETVHVTDARELAPEDQRFCEATKAWFNIDFVPKMSRVLLTVPEFGRSYGRASRRAMADGALSRAQKELIATMVSAINVCEY